MISVVGWGVILAGLWAAREIARAQQEAEVVAKPVPVRSDKRPRR